LHALPLFQTINLKSFLCFGVCCDAIGSQTMALYFHAEELLELNISNLWKLIFFDRQLWKLILLCLELILLCLETKIIMRKLFRCLINLDSCYLWYPCDIYGIKVYKPMSLLVFNRSAILVFDWDAEVK
jgi:hypothetical protein